MSTFDAEYYGALEAALGMLTDALAPHLKADQIAFLREENAAGEYGLVLETMVDYIGDAEKEDAVGPAVLRRIYALAIRIPAGRPPLQRSEGRVSGALAGVADLGPRPIAARGTGIWRRPAPPRFSRPC